MRLFEPDIVGVCWECGDALDNDIVPAEQPGYWSHTPCDLEAALEPDTVAERLEHLDLLPLVLADTRRTAVERPPPR